MNDTIYITSHIDNFNYIYETDVYEIYYYLTHVLQNKIPRKI